MLQLLRLPSGTLIFASAELTREEALEVAQRLFDMWGLQAPHISRYLMYALEPRVFDECPHYIVGEEATLKADLLREWPEAQHAEEQPKCS